jgi:large exoprotein involved in heme utilization and adhesion
MLGTTSLASQASITLINASGRALTNAAIHGGSLEDTLKAALIGAMVDTAHGAAASQIKGLEADYIAHKLAHALAGCAAGAAAGGACQDGAIGAAPSGRRWGKWWRGS